MAQTKKILLVDDSQIFLMGLRMAFHAADWVDGIFEARNQDQALKMLESHDDISLAIIDVCLEKRADGLELIRQIKDKHPAVKTLVLSQYKNPDFICRAIVSGAYAYIAKDSEADVIVSQRTCLPVCSGMPITSGPASPISSRSRSWQYCSMRHRATVTRR